MKRFSIHFIILSLFFFTSSFGLIEYHSLKTKAKTIQLDSTQKTNSIQSLKKNYSTSLQEKQTSQKEKEDSNLITESLTKYLMIGVKTIFTTIIKIVLSF